MVKRSFVLRIKFSGGRQFSSPKSPTSCSCKTLSERRRRNFVGSIFLPRGIGEARLQAVVIAHVEGGSVMNRLIVSDPDVMMGKPVVRGTRITVESILDRLAAGETVEQVLDAHPRLTREAIQAALAYAADALRADVTYLLPDEAA